MVRGALGPRRIESNRLQQHVPAMLNERSRKLDLIALALAAGAVFLGISLASYDPADPPSTLVYPPASHIANACGRAGALAADLLLNAVGLGAYYLAATIGLVSLLLLARRAISDPWLRAAGWGATLVGFDTLVAIAGPNWSVGPVIGPGGYLGAAGCGLLELHFARAGAYLLTLSLLAGGLLLSTDYILARLVLGAWGRRRALPGAVWPHAVGRTAPAPRAIRSPPRQPNSVKPRRRTP